MTQTSLFYVNGSAAGSIALTDRGFQYGDGVFTTVAIDAEGHPAFWTSHLERLRTDSCRIGLPAPDAALLTEHVLSLCRQHPDSVLKVQITRGSGGRGYRPPEHPAPTIVLGIHPPPDLPHSLATEGIRARLCQTRLAIQPALAGLKHMNRLEQVLARSEWSDDAIREGVMLDTEGYLVEGTATNLFLVSDGTLQTPLIDRCGVAGVMRREIIRLAETAALPFEETRLRVEELFAADEVFLSNSLIGIWPVRIIDDHPFRVGPTSLKLAASIQSRRSASKPA